MQASPRIIVDGDPAVYRAGFASQQAYYVIVYETKDGTLQEHTQQGDPRDWKKQLAKEGGVILHQEQRVVPKDVKIAKLSLNAQFKSIYRECAERLASPVPPVMEIIMSGSGNYRNKIATIMGYKANRKDMVKPYHYDAIRKHISDTWSAAFVNGREADDDVAIRMTNAETDGVRSVLVTIDKDLDQIPGLHYNYKHHVFYDVTHEEAVLLFYAQALSGDPTDNIPGLRGIGPATAKDMVLGWHATWLKHNPTKRKQVELEKFLWQCVVESYENIPLGLPGEEEYTGPLTAEEKALEMARLVWLQRRHNQLWNPPGIPHDEVAYE